MTAEDEPPQKKRGRPRKTETDKVAAALQSAPVDDEPVTAEDRKAIDSARAELLRTPLTGTVERLQKTDDAATLVCIRVPMTGVFPIALGQEVEIV